MARTFVYQNRIILFFAFILFLWVAQAYLKKKANHFLYVEVVPLSGNHSDS